MSDLEELEKLAASEPIQATFIAQDFAKITAVWADKATRQSAEAILKSWEEHGSPLRKAMSTAWLARAKSTLAHAVEVKGAKSGSSSVAHRGPSEGFREPPPEKNHPDAQGYVEREEGHSERLAPKKTLQASLGDRVSQHAARNRRKNIRAGLKLGVISASPGVAVGAAAVGHHILSDKQRDERRTAAKARWEKARQVSA